MFVALASVALAAEARLSWRGGTAHVEVVAEGEHVNPDAPSTLIVGDLRAETRGDPAVLSFPVAPGPVSVDLTVGLCTDGSTSCRTARFCGGAAIRTPRGTLAIAEVGAQPDGRHPVRPGAGPPSTCGGSSASAAPDAVATGKPLGRSGVVKVIDFGAVWCPPCNLLAAEVIHAGGTSGVPVEAIDVDRPDSWEQKSRYSVGGYPTLVAVDASGREIDRLVGYPGLAETRAWFARLPDLDPLDALPTDTPAARATAARRLAEAERKDAARALFATAEDNVDLHVARLLVDPTDADARWLFDHHTPAGDWVYAALGVTPALWPQAAALAPTVPAVQGADLLGASAEYAPHETGIVLEAAALALLQTALTGDPDHDRGNVTYLADLMADTGDLDGAIALLDDYAGRYPGEFTFTFSAGRHLFDAGRLPEAEKRARAALGVAWGNQRLRAAALLARVLGARGQKPEAVLVIDAALHEVPAPPEGIAVRTTRYRKELETLRGELAK